jgi:transcriptional regulator with XRE-family HTH domain
MSQIGMSYFPLALGSPMVEQNAPVNFGDWLKATRQKKGMSLRALAAAAGVSHVSVDKAERGGGVRDSTLELLVGALAGPDASPEEAQELLLEARRVRAGLTEIVREPTDDPDFWDAYEGAPQEDREIAKQLLQRARDRERARTIGGKIAE